MGEAQIDPQVLDALRDTGEARVIIQLALDLPADASDAERLAAIHELQMAILADLSDTEFQLNRQYESIPALSGTLNRAGLDKLAAHPNVGTITLDQPIGP